MNGINLAFLFSFRVYLEDTDAGGIVYHANHLKYLERARREWLRSRGLAHYSARDDYQFVVQKANLHYVAPILMDDVMTITIYPKKVGFASIYLQQNIYRGEIASVLKHMLEADSDDTDTNKGDYICLSALDKLSDRLLTKAEVVLASIGKNHKPIRMPPDLLAILKT